MGQMKNWKKNWNNWNKASHRRRLKQGSAIFLAALMALGSNVTAYAGEYGKLARAKDISAQMAAAAAGPRSIVSVAGGRGQVDVSIGSALELQKQVDFTVCLTDALGEQLTGIITLGGDSALENRLNFEGLAEGVYHLSVSAEGFAAYTQNIAVKDKSYIINLTTGFLGGMNYEEGAAHPGVLLIGDVNGDGVNDAADRTELVNAINSGSNSSLMATDLNGDNATNLVDLQYMAAGYSGGRDTLAKIENSVPAAAIASSAGGNTNVEGSLDALLRSQASVILKPGQEGGISDTNPVSLEFDFGVVSETAMADGIIIETGGNNPISKAVFEITYMDVDESGMQVEKTELIPVVDGVDFLMLSSQVRAEKDQAGNIRLYLGSQVAIKKVTFTISQMSNNNNLAEISKVEFVNGMEERIQEPQMDVPENLTATAGSKMISLKWDPCVNVTGYEVLIRQGDKQETLRTVKNELTVTSFGGKEMVNYLEYQIQVQSVNGTWSSGYCNEVTAIPKPTGKPDKPDNVSAKGQYQSVVVSWKQMKDTLTYNLYYKESSAGEYQKIEGIAQNSYTINNLADLTEYIVYVTGVNEFGESAPSLSVSAVTTDLNAAAMPKYNLINTGGEGEAGAHIVSATMSGTMVDSPLDTEAGTAWGTVDHNPKSYYFKDTWDDGGYNTMQLFHGLTYEFDQAYKMDTIAFTTMPGINSSIFYQRVRYWDEDGNMALCSVSRQSKTDAEGRPYFVLKLSEPVNAKKLQFALACYDTAGRISVSDVNFYYYDTLMDEIMALYEDDLHTVLRADVTQQTIDALRVKINTVDEVSGEYHPDRELLERELQTAETILNDGKLNDSVIVHGGITTKDVGRGFGGLNAWQPLGVVAEAQEEIMVYVGHSTLKTGANTNLQLVATQYHAETGPMFTTVATLKVGANKITIPKIWSITGYESGGALYVQYTGDSASDQYAVRVSGGVQVPKLDLYHVTDSAERLARTKTYVEELQQYVSGIEAKHAEVHKYSENVKLEYDKQNCILGAADILLDTMMFSLPAQQILAGAGSGSTEEQAQRILASMDAMEDMMYLFYQHKGLNSAAADAVNQIPKGHLNIRYQRMFSGAFMYASGNHIGIEWNETAGMMTSQPVVSDEEGRYQSGRYFGWGIAHEIGHCINQGTYAVAEITNNYYAVLAQAKDTNNSVRFQYANVFDKVTSGAKGAASNVFTQLGMYWQLHIAYDKGYNYKTYEDYDEQLANLFFARVDTYARSTAKAPAPGGVALTLSGDKNQDLMRLSCAAAEKNILLFFERWGMTPDEGTKAYAGQFAEETRAIYYANDEARVYSFNGGTSSLNSEGTTEAVGDNVTAALKAGSANQVDITLGSKNIPEADVLGYEIVRCMYAGGEIIKETAGFATKDKATFTDTVYVNNRMIWYEVRVIDQYLNQSAVKVLEPMKIEHDGSLEKTYWTVATENLIGSDDVSVSDNQDSLCSAGSVTDTENEDVLAGQVVGAAKLIDNDVNTVYTATANGSAGIILEFNKTLTVTGFKYQGAGGMTGEYEVSVRSNGEWNKVASGSWGESGVQYFSNLDGGYVGTFVTDAVKVTFNGGQVSIAELDVLGVTGDNVDFRRVDDGTVVIGTLSADYRFGDNEGNVIPAGSILFTGAYKGSPDYNTVILYDQNGNIVGGVDQDGSLKAQQIILAEVPDEGLIQNVSDGTWIYWIEPDQQIDISGITKVRAELYRVNNALTQEGQRLVSDSLWEAVPSTLPEIQLSGNAGQNSDASQNVGADGNSDANPNAGADGNGDANPNVGADGNSGADQNAGADVNGDANQNSNAG